MGETIESLARAAFASDETPAPAKIVIAVDAMGSDRAPKPEIEGAIQAARHRYARVMLVGRSQEIKAELANHPAAA